MGIIMRISLLLLICIFTRLYPQSVIDVTIKGISDGKIFIVQTFSYYVCQMTENSKDKQPKTR